MRIGFGFDAHAFAQERDLWLGGIKIDFPKGLTGHSDADVLIHAICDALLGAANMRDIGFHFPPSENKYKNIDSKILLRNTVQLLRNAGYELGNLDATIVAEQPKLSPYIPQMRKTLAQTMQVPENDISIKATTTEKLGFAGREEGIAACAVALIV
ncbi:MAG: 2-C-methyl-D-erythritol 2,4-cyclodiphosphate synthase [Tannerella sp.]|jgi:2-C-methyl-D-erythritol 2,4-cyclodiphosphate synthase|nr:2-C-methyl-D-erythritol 2,4-cyclodiphosphate synthase [Tannerella sp.]